MQSDHHRLTIVAATIAAELHHAERTARLLTLSAKNAAAIVLRAGRSAAGLSVISSFYDELAGRTIKLARTINATAIRLSSVTVSEWRTTAAVERLKLASTKASTEDIRHTIAGLEGKIEGQLESISESFTRCVSALGNDLREIQTHMRAIDVVAVTSRIEAQNAGDFRASLIHMASTIQSQTGEIKVRVNRSLSLLDHAVQSSDPY